MVVGTVLELTTSFNIRGFVSDSKNPTNLVHPVDNNTLCIFQRPEYLVLPFTTEIIV